MEEAANLDKNLFSLDVSPATSAPNIKAKRSRGKEKNGNTAMDTGPGPGPAIAVSVEYFEIYMANNVNDKLDQLFSDRNPQPKTPRT